jgi:hypothetical protein
LTKRLTVSKDLHNVSLRKAVQGTSTNSRQEKRHFLNDSEINETAGGSTPVSSARGQDERTTLTSVSRQAERPQQARQDNGDVRKGGQEKKQQ